jgi:hypothetical protein
MSWCHPFITIDQNQLRKPELVSSIVSECQSNGWQILLADGAVLEFSKNGVPFETAKRSLELLAPHREIVCSARKLTSMMRDELRDGWPCSELVEDEPTQLLRSLLADLDAGSESALQTLVDGPVAKMLPPSLQVWNDHETNKRLVSGLCEVISRGVTPEKLKLLRQCPENAATVWLSTNSAAFVFEGIKARGADGATAYRLTQRPSVTAGFLTALQALAIDWLAHGGVESAKPKELSGDLHDVEYIILGALSQSLATSDRRAARIWRAVASAFDCRRSLPQLVASR